MNGIICINKPKDWTSFDVVAKIRGIIRHETGEKVKVGHAGTLDPAATGLLVVAVEKGTKTIPQLIKQDKTYEVSMEIGKTSTTDDSEGEITEVPTTEITQEVIMSTIQSFLGEITQVPPQFSAIKINGKRAYDLARQGKQVEMQPRQVTVHSIESIEVSWPKVTFITNVSSGTYIRSLVRDIGVALGSGAYMTDLRRTSVGSFQISQALKVEDLSYAKLQEYVQPLS